MQRTAAFQFGVQHHSPWTAPESLHCSHRHTHTQWEGHTLRHTHLTAHTLITESHTAARCPSDSTDLSLRRTSRGGDRSLSFPLSLSETSSGRSSLLLLFAGSQRAALTSRTGLVWFDLGHTAGRCLCAAEWKHPEPSQPPEMRKPWEWKGYNFKHREGQCSILYVELIIIKIQW